MWSLNTDWWEIILRALIIFAILHTLFRVAGKKELGKMSPFDFVLLLIVSESVSNALTGGDDSLTAGLISAAALIGLSSLVDRLAYHFKKFEDLVDGQPQVIIANGAVRKDVMKKEKITMDELSETLRQNGLSDFKQVRFGVLETNGKISIIRNELVVTP